MSARALPESAAGRTASRERLWPRLTVFFALATFVSLRYAALVTAPPTARIVAVVACVTAGCWTLALSGRLSALPAHTLAALRAALVAATLALSLLALGLPAHLLQPGGWGSLAGHVDTGVERLGSWLWPYRGGDEWARTTVLLVIPAALVLAGAVCFWPSRTAVAGRRAAALLALVAVFLTGAANTPSPLPALQGLVLLALAAGTLLRPTAPAREGARALRWLGVCGLLALTAESALAGAGPWLDYRDGGAGQASGVAFQWDQLYGPIAWSRSPATLLTVTASHPTLLRVTSLDRFDGLRFLRSDAPPGARALDQGDRSERARFGEHATVQVSGLRSGLLVGGGGLTTGARWLSSPPAGLRQSADGTVALGAALPTGAVYEVASYVPQPTPQRARLAPRAFPRAYLPYVEFDLPAAAQSALGGVNLARDARGEAPHGALVVPSAPGHAPAEDPAAARLVEASPYAPMFTLARRLAAGAPSPYDVAVRMVNYLRSHYVYDERVPLTRYPLESFLFGQGRGYCEQFSGAMALMLRMDGIPARVGAGFRAGVFDPATGSWHVRGVDAHSWVEVFFTGIGWVSFDPTPAQSFAQHTGGGEAVSRVVQLGRPPSNHSAQLAASVVTAPARPTARPRGQIGPFALGIALVLSLALAGAFGVGHLRLHRALAGDGERLLAELRRGMALVPGYGPALTLARLERELDDDGRVEAAAYVRRLRALRYAPLGAADPSSVRGRAQLRRALGVSGGRLRALRAFPPGWMRG